MAHGADGLAHEPGEELFAAVALTQQNRQVSETGTRFFDRAELRHTYAHVHAGSMADVAWR